MTLSKLLAKKPPSASFFWLWSGSDGLGLVSRLQDSVRAVCLLTPFRNLHIRLADSCMRERLAR